MDLFRSGLRSMFSQRVLWLLFLLLLAVYWWNTFADREYQQEPFLLRVLMATLSAASVGGLAFLATALIIASQSFRQRDQGVLGEHTLEITDEGLVESTTVNRSLANWNTVFRIRDTRHYVYIYVADYNAHVIPRRKALLEGSVDAFMVELRAKMSEKSWQTPSRPSDR